MTMQDGMSYQALYDNLPELIDRKRVVISAPHLPNVEDEIAVSQAEVSTEWAKDFIPSYEDPTEPCAEIFYPIIDLPPDAIAISEDKDFGDSTVVGIISLSIYWRDLIRNILPVGSRGIVCVFENTCGKSFTYKMYGPQVEYLGRGDLHDSRYNSQRQSSTLFDLKSFSDFGHATYEGVPVSEDVCPYTLSVYPSAEREDDHRTSNPAIFTASALLIFLFTSL
jgi:hypothetical protein